MMVEGGDSYLAEQFSERSELFMLQKPNCFFFLCRRPFCFIKVTRKAGGCQMYITRVQRKTVVSVYETSRPIRHSYGKPPSRKLTHTFVESFE